VLTDEELFMQITIFMNMHFIQLKKCDLEAFKMASWERVFPICRQGNVVESIAQNFLQGYGCVVPVELQVEGHIVKGCTFIIIIEMLELMRTKMLPTRKICPGASILHHGNHNNNYRPFPYN
jgi:hypothetical protein